MTYLAQLPSASSTEAIGWVVLIIFGLVGGFNQLVAAWQRLKGQPPAEQLDQAGRELTRRIEAVERDNAIGRKTIYGKIEDARAESASNTEMLRKEIKSDMGDLHEKVNSLGKEVAGLGTSNTLQNQQLARIESKLDRSIESHRR